MPLPVSIPVVTLNEERNLDRCLKSIAGFGAEIIVMDSGSTDGTRRIAEAHGARWVHQDWLGYRDQKNAVLALCTQPWVLALDADEEVSPAMMTELQEFFREDSGQAQRYAGASFPRKVWFLGRWIKHGDWYPDRKLRLVRREGAKWSGSPEHDFLEVPGETLKCRGDLHHFSFPDMARYIAKINIFAGEYLKREIAANKRWSAFGAVGRPFWRFFRSYVLRRGFLDGFPGFWIAISTAYQTFIRHSRLYEHERRGEPPP